MGSGGGSGDKMPVMIAVERNGTRKLGRVRLAVAARPNTGELVDWATQVIEPGSTVRTDGLRTLRRLSSLGYTHEYTTGYNSKNQASVLPGVHLVASLLKGWLIGTLHYRVEEHQLPYYRDEYTFRVNRRNAKSRGLLFYRLLQQAVVTDPHPLAELLKPGEPEIPDFTQADMQNICSIHTSCQCLLGCFAPPILSSGHAPPERRAGSEPSGIRPRHCTSWDGTSAPSPQSTQKWFLHSVHAAI